ncbi:MAG: hypothetical protein FWG39_00250 [Alphaproteobacteria bacterium]|nr:hypothetical protein [Alphaproteobacteria bacterium]
MDYPNNFDTPPFPESRKIALSRFAAVWYLVLFFVIASLCGLVVWTVHSVRLSPYIISIDNVTGEWRVISEKSKSDDAVSKEISMQESVVWRFATEWFRVTESAARNAANWCECEVASCAGTACFICCASDALLYKSFSESVLPVYKDMAEGGETQRLRRDSITISPVSGPDGRGGMWRAQAVLEQSAGPDRNMEIYVRVQRNESVYPLTLGYYVADFNWYVTGI